MEINCGADCFNPDRTTSISSLLQTIESFLGQSTKKRLPALAFHLFTQSPLNQSMEAHFSPLFTESNSVMSALDVIHVYDSLHAHSLLHHLATSDVLIMNPSNPMSSLAILLSDALIVRDPIAMKMPFVCENSMSDYDQSTGRINWKQFHQVFQSWSKNGTKKASTFTRFDSLQDCIRLGET